ncbi:MAG: hypothetical protein AO396_05095 [Candidatus Fermentibacter daniensis]|nr:MAG: hypothetical protein AO396_05095 [Candidatus Fermentibacter daniensis]
MPQRALHSRKASCRSACCSRPLGFTSLDRCTRYSRASIAAGSAGTNLSAGGAGPGDCLISNPLQSGSGSSGSGTGSKPDVRPARAGEIESPARPRGFVCLRLVHFHASAKRTGPSLAGSEWMKRITPGSAEASVKARLEYLSPPYRPTPEPLTSVRILEYLPSRRRMNLFRSSPPARSSMQHESGSRHHASSPILDSSRSAPASAEKASKSSASLKRSSPGPALAETR